MHSTSGARPTWMSSSANNAQSLTFGKTWRPGQLKDVMGLSKELKANRAQEKAQEKKDQAIKILNNFKEKHGNFSGANDLDLAYDLAYLYRGSPSVRKHADLLAPLIQEWVETLDSPIKVSQALHDANKRLTLSWREIIFSPLDSLKSLFSDNEKHRSIFMPQVFLQPLLARKRELVKREICQWPPPPSEKLEDDVKPD
jgi:hypothetical protein